MLIYISINKNLTRFQSKLTNKFDFSGDLIHSLEMEASSIQKVKAKKNRKVLTFLVAVSQNGPRSSRLFWTSSAQIKYELLAEPTRQGIKQTRNDMVHNKWERVIKVVSHLQVFHFMPSTHTHKPGCMWRHDACPFCGWILCDVWLRKPRNQCQF